MKCKSCGTDLTGELRFCPHCGVRLLSSEDSRCKSCDEPLETRWKFCPMCGCQAVESDKPQLTSKCRTCYYLRYDDWCFWHKKDISEVNKNCNWFKLKPR